MRVLIITDLEGVNGVLNFNDWCVPSGLRNEAGCRFLTEEVNAAVKGFFQGGATEVIVEDGHGSGGSIRGEMLDKRAALLRGGKDFPIAYDQVDVLAFVGQHAKAGTANAHLAHTQTEEAVYFKLNGVEIGEFGQLAYAYSELNVPTVMATGDLALTVEAQDLVPGIFTVAVKEGFNKSVGAECSAEKLFACESSALHYPRQEVLDKITQAAAAAMQKFLQAPESFAIKPLQSPYQVQAQYRTTAPRLVEWLGELPPRVITTSEHASICSAIKEFYTELEWKHEPDDRIVKL